MKVFILFVHHVYSIPDRQNTKLPSELSLQYFVITSLFNVENAHNSHMYFSQFKSSGGEKARVNKKKARTALSGVADARLRHDKRPTPL